MLNLSVGQCFLQVSYASLGDFGVVEAKCLKTRHPLEMHKARVGDFGVVEIKIIQLRQSLEMHQTSVCYFVFLGTGFETVLGISGYIYAILK